jgi:2-dehydropantoate 2-reductase
VDNVDNSDAAANPIRVAVLGPGGVGGLLAAVLAHAGHEVVCLAGDSTVEVLREKGLRLSSVRFGEFTARVEADTRLREPVDLCFIGVKQTALEDSLNRLSPEALGDGLIVPMLNGVDHPALLRERYRPELVAPAMIRVESTRLEPGVIAHTSPFADIDLASTTAPRARLDHAAGVLRAAGFVAEVLDDEATVVWTKMTFLAPMGLLTTRYLVPVGEIREKHWDELLAAGAELVAVARACGAEVDFKGVEDIFRNAPAAMKSSMQRDAEAGRPLELDAIGGAVLRAAALHGVPVPTMTSLVLEISVRQG